MIVVVDGREQCRLKNPSKSTKKKRLKTMKALKNKLFFRFCNFLWTNCLTIFSPSRCYYELVLVGRASLWLKRFLNFVTLECLTNCENCFIFHIIYAIFQSTLASLMHCFHSKLMMYHLIVSTHSKSKSNCFKIIENRTESLTESWADILPNRVYTE